MSSIWKEQIPDTTTKRAKTIAVLLNKGGTGKTETSLNLAYGLSKKDKKVLLIDFDPSSNLTSIILDAGNPAPISGFNALTQMFNDSPKGIGDVINDKMDVRSVIRGTRFPNLDVISSGGGLELTDMVLKASGDMKALRSVLKPIEGDYDYIIIDCQPFQNTLTYNALCACYKKHDLVIFPVKIDRGGLQGIQSTLATAIRWLEKEDLDYDVKLLITMKNRNQVDQKWENALREGFEDTLLKSVIRYQGKPVTDASLSKRILLETPNSPVAQDYQNFVDEIAALEDVED